MYYEYSVRQPKKIILTSNDPPEAYGNTMYVCPYCGICLPADNKNGSTKKYFTKHIKTKHPNRLELDTPKMHGTHKELKTEAPSLLLEKGYIQNQIFEEYPCYYGNSHTYKIDMVGINVIFYDNNLLSYPKHLEILEKIRDEKYKACFNQGLDFQFINDDNASLISEIKYYDRKFKHRRLYFAFDRLNLEPNSQRKSCFLKQKRNTI